MVDTYDLLDTSKGYESYWQMVASVDGEGEWVRREDYRKLEAENDRLNMEMVAYRHKLTPKDVEAMTAVIEALTAEKAARAQPEYCSDCPPVGCYATDHTRCAPCPRRSTNSGEAKP